MSKKRTDEQRATFMGAPAYSATLPSFTVNLVVRDVEASLPFYRDVLGASVKYADPDFAALSLAGLDFMLHAGHTYDQHESFALLQSATRRGLGAELRLLGVDPDAVEARAHAANVTVVRGATTMGHGMREVTIEDRDGYTWVLGVLTELG